MANTKSLPRTDLLSALQARLSANVTPGQRLCVALSGGVDSVVLLHATATLANSLQLGELRATHVNHGLSTNADDWEKFCNELCEQLGLKIETHQVEVRAQGEGIEAAARKARHQALAGCDSDWILLGHHQDDQAETMLLNLLRGAGVHGAAGMAEKNGRLLRPFLNTPREKIIAYARDVGLSWVEDESNSNNHFRRNFLRNEIVPSLSSAFPQALSNLARAASIFAESVDLLDQIAKDDLGEARLLQVDQLKKLSTSRATNLLAYYLRQHDLMIPASTMLIELLRQLLAAASDSQIHFAVGDREIRRFQGRVYIEHPTTKLEAVSWSGEKVLPWGRYRITSHSVRGNGIASSLLKNVSLMFSLRRGGETLQLIPEGPRRPLKDLLREAGIPPWRRRSLPVLYAGEDLVWVAGVGISSKYRCKAEAEGILIEFDGVTW